MIRMNSVALLTASFIAGFGCERLFAMAGQVSSTLVVSGHVTDPQCNPIASLRVRVFAENRNAAGEQLTDKDGYFRILVDLPGTYTLQVGAPGFQQVTRSVQVMAGQPAIADVQLGKIAEKRESIAVTADVKDASILFPDPAQRVRAASDIGCEPGPA